MELRRTMVAAIVTGSVVLGAVPAVANSGDVIRRGHCSGSSTWKVKASPEDGRIEFDGEVDSNVNGQLWRWRMVHNGSRAARGTATTKAPSGSFERRRLLVDVAGTDNLVFRAKHPASGEVCRGKVRF